MRWPILSTLLLITGVARGASDRLQIATCPREGAEYDATLDDRIVMDRAFLDGPATEEAQIRETILHQLRYLWGYYRTRDKSPDAMQIVLAADDPEITIKKKTRAPYGRDLALDWKDDAPRLVVSDRYTLHAVKAGAIHAGDEALVIDYRARFRVAICGEPRPDLSSLKVQLPADPWLAYWLVPKKAHRPMRYLDEPQVVTNPCADDDFADLPHPFYYWYDWQVDRYGPDDTGKQFDCRTILKPEVDYFARTIELKRAPPPSADFAALKRAFSTGNGPLTTTVILGVLDHAWGPLKLEELAAELNQGAPSLPKRAASLLEVAVRRERGTQKFLRLLADLPSLMTPRTTSVQVVDGYLRAIVEGDLRQSQRAIRLTVWLGPTDIFGPAPPQHWSIARRALTGEQMVIYAGHSGLGENLRLTQIEENTHVTPTQLKAELDRAPVQLIAFLSCYSYMYYGRDLMAAAKARPVAGREFVYTGSEYTKGDRGALALIDLVDQVLAATGKAPAIRFVDPGDFLIIKGF